MKIYEIENSFRESDIKSANTRIDHLVTNNRSIVLKKQVIKDDMFLYLKSLLKESVKPFLRNRDYRLPEIPEEKFDFDNFYPEKFNIDEIKEYKEGMVKKVFINVYERDRKAREKCIKNFGCKCLVCSFDFEEKYGERGKDFIHVHHKIPLSEIGKEYHLNPINDLVPICPNCHAMLHRHKPAISIEDLKEIMLNNCVTSV